MQEGIEYIKTQITKEIIKYVFLAESFLSKRRFASIKLIRNIKIGSMLYPRMTPSGSDNLKPRK